MLALRILFCLEVCKLVIAIRNLVRADLDSPLASVNFITRQLGLSRFWDTSDLSEVASTLIDFLELFGERVGLLKIDLKDLFRFVDVDCNSPDCRVSRQRTVESDLDSLILKD